jgi:hypothetical protein
MLASFSDKIQVDYKAYAEPVLLQAMTHQAKKIGMTRSQYIRDSMIRRVVKEGYPLGNVSPKFNELLRGMTYKS